MCGINGFVTKKDIDFNENDRIVEMNNSIIHRGPDDSGHFMYKDCNISLAIGMRRLSIIDLQTGHQPMFSSDKKIIIVFNGEIYNYQELRSSLIAKGCQFSTQSDTEVVLRLYEMHGIDCLLQLNGMFGLCIYDQRVNKLFLSRDRLGEKPLYFYQGNGTFIFSSELKAIINNFKIDKNISKKALSLFLTLSFIPAPYTIFKGMQKLQAAHYLELDIESFTFSTNKYWDSEPLPVPSVNNYDEAKETLKKLVIDAVISRTIADVPIGVFLSGGIDSSVVSAIMARNMGSRKIKTFSIGFTDPEFDESQTAAMVANHIGSDHTMVKLNADDLRNNLDEIILNYDEPFADSSALATYWVSKLARQHVKVALTGDGGDEVFGGYNRYRINDYYKKLKKYVPTATGLKVVQHLMVAIPTALEDRKSRLYLAKKTIKSLSNNPLRNFTNIISLAFQESELHTLLLPEWQEYSSIYTMVQSQIPSHADPANVHWMRYIDKNISLEGDMLVKVDRASMLTSLECRAPFLDHRLFEFTNTIPANFLISNGNKKRILKDAFRDWLPEELLTLPKSGFGVPVGKWLRHELQKEMASLLDPVFLESQGIFNINTILNLRHKHFKGSQDNTIKLWTLFCFQKWYKRYF